MTNLKPMIPELSIQLKSSEHGLSAAIAKGIKLYLTIEDCVLSKTTRSLTTEFSADTEKFVEEILVKIQEAKRILTITNKGVEDPNEVLQCSLEIITQNLIIDSQKLGENADNANRLTDFQCHLVNVIKETDEIFRMFEDTAVCEILAAINMIKKQLQCFEHVTTTEQFIPPFKIYTQALLTLLSLIAKRQKDLRSDSQSRLVGTAAISLKKVAPYINKCYQLHLRHPADVQAEENKRSVTIQILSLLGELVDAVEFTKPHVKGNRDSMADGKFVSTVDQVLEYLKTSHRNQHVSDNEFQCLVVRTVRHCVSVANTASAGSNQSADVIKMCIQVLEDCEKVTLLSKNCKANPTFLQSQEDLKHACESAIRDVHEMERRVNSLLIYGVIDTLKETSQPLHRLIASALNYHEETDAAKSLVQPFLDDFCQHADAVCFVTRLAADSSSNAATVRSLYAAADELEKLQAEILPAISQWWATRSHQSLKHVKDRWQREMNSIVNSVNDISGPFVFADVTESLQIKYQTASKDLLKAEMFDMNAFADSVRAQLGLCSRLMAVVSKYSRLQGEINPGNHGLDKLQGFLTKATSDVESSCDALALAPDDEDYCIVFNKRTQHLLKWVEMVKLYLSGELPLIDSAMEESDGERDKSAVVEAAIADVSNERDVSDGTLVWLSLEPGSSTHLPNSATINISELPTSANHSPDVDLADLVQRLIHAVLESDTAMVDTVVDMLLQRSNQIIEVSNRISVCCKSSSADKTQLQESTSALTQQSVELIGSVIPKAQSDISCFDRLTYLLQDWSRNVEVLETCCDRLLHEYLVHVKDILSGFEMQNSHLLASGMASLTAVNQALLDAITTNDNFGESFRLSSQYTAQLQAATGTVATLCSNTDQVKIGLLRAACRVWAMTVFAMVQDCRQMALSNMMSTCNVTGCDLASMLSCDLKYVKRAYSSVFQIGNESVKKEAGELLAEIDDILTAASSSYKSSDVEQLHYYLCCIRFSEKVDQFNGALDELLEPLSTKLSLLSKTAINIHSGNSDTAIQEYETMKAEIQLSLNDLCQEAGKASWKLSNQRLEYLRESFTDLFAAHDEIMKAPALTDDMMTKCKFAQRLAVISLLEVRELSPHSEQHTQQIIHLPHPDKQDMDRSLGKLLNDSADGLKKSNGSSISELRTNRGVDMYLPRHGASPRAPDTPFHRAVRKFQGSLQKWTDGRNVVVQSAQELSQCLTDICLYIKHHSGPIASRHALFNISRKSMSLTMTIAQFSDVIKKYSLSDLRSTEELSYHTNQMKFFAEQLNMLCNVKRSTHEYDLTIKALLKNAENLMSAILKVFDACEAVLIKGLSEPPDDAQEEQQVYNLATRWRASLLRFQRSHVAYSDVNDLGLRVVMRNESGPRLAELCQPAIALH